MQFTTWRMLLKYIDLRPQDQDFGSQPPARLEAVVQHLKEEKGNPIINRNHVLIRLPPSLPTDGVFGSDTMCQHAKQGILRHAGYVPT
jgi:hypothetical protein